MDIKGKPTSIARQTKATVIGIMQKKEEKASYGELLDKKDGLEEAPRAVIIARLAENHRF